MRVWIWPLALLLAGCESAAVPPVGDSFDTREDAGDAVDRDADTSPLDDGADAADALVDVGDALVDAVDGVDGADGEGLPDTEVSTDPAWHSMLADLPEGIYDVWGSAPTDVWLVGAGGLLAHGGPEGWRQLDLRAIDGSGAALRGVFGPDADTVWAVGDEGRVYRWVRSVGGAAAIESGTRLALTAVWGASDAEMWAVGGTAFAGRGGASSPPVIVKLSPSGGAPVDLPDDLPADAELLDVWGATADDVWAVGEQGLVLHYDGAAWSKIDVGRTDRLAAVHGHGAEVVIGGGDTDALILVKPDAVSGFAAASIDDAPSLNGIAIGDDGAAWAAGVLGQTFVRASGQSAWQSQTSSSGTYWHEVWVDARGDAWLAGEGLVSRFGPDRFDLPSGALVRLDDPDPDSDSDVEVVDTSDATETIDDSADTAEPVDAVTQDDWPFKIGQAPPDDPSALTPFVGGQDVAIVHGPQGGIHVETIVRFPWASSDASVAANMKLYLEIGGIRKALYEVLAYPVPALSNGVYQTYVMPVQFDCIFIAPYCTSTDFDGVRATLKITVEPPGQSWTKTLDLLLHDSF